MKEQILEVINFMIEAYAHAWPYLLVTIPLAVIVNVSGISKYIEKAFSAKPLMAVLLATIVGAFSPFCSCGVIPIISALLIGGVPLAPVMSFWLASPSMDPEVFFLSVSQLGMTLAVWRLAGTFLMSLLGGYITHILVQSNWIGSDILKLKKEKIVTSPVLKPISIVKSQFTPVPAVAGGESCSCSSEPSVTTETTCCSSSKKNTQTVQNSGCSTGCDVSSNTSGKNDLFTKILNESKVAVIMIVKFMSLAFFLEALIVLYIPEEWIISVLGSQNSFAIPVSTVIGIPLYTTNLTALGLMGGLLTQGMAPAAVLAFLIGGATTTVPAMAAVYGIVKPRIFILYLSYTLGASLITGYLFQLFN